MNHSLAYRTGVLDSPEAIDRIAPAWRRLLAASTAPSLDLDPAWARLQEEATGAELLVVIAERPGGELAGIAPFLRRPFDWAASLGGVALAHFPVRLATLLGNAPLTADGDVEAERALGEGTRELLTHCDIAFFEAMPRASAYTRVLGQSAGGWLRQAGPPGLHRLIRMPESLEAYYRGMSGRVRQQCKARLRRMEAFARSSGGELRAVRFAREEDVGAFIAAAGAVSAKGWKGARLGKVIGEASHRPLLHALARAGRLRSHVLFAGDAPVAFVHGTQGNGVYRYEHPAYDPAYADHAPGRVLLQLLLADLFEHDTPAIFDFGRGDADYKRLYANDAFEEEHLYVVRKGLRTALASGTHDATSTITRAVTFTLDRLALRGQVRALVRRRGQPGPARAPEDAAA